MDFKETHTNLLYANYNEDQDCVIFGTKTGFYVYTLYPQKKIISQKINGGVSKVSMLHRSNIIFFVGTLDNGDYCKQNLNIWDDNRKKIVGQINFKENIHHIETFTGYIFISTKKNIYIYNFDNLKLLKSLPIKNNTKGLFKVIIDTTQIVYPNNNTIELYNWTTKQTNIINCHINTVEHFSLSNDNSLLATCSQKGSIIRLFNVNTLQLIKELRRGTEYVRIINLVFNNDNTQLLCSSNKGTIHIFSIENINNSIENLQEESKENVKEKKEKEQETINGKIEILQKVSSIDDQDDQDDQDDTDKQTEEKNIIENKKIYGMYYLQSFLPKYFNSEWSFIQIYLNNSFTHNAFSKNKNNLISISSNGCFYTIEYSYDYKTSKSSYKIISTLKFLSDTNDPFDNRNSTIL